MPANARLRLLPAALFALALGGCALPIAHPGARLDMPATWAEAAARDRAASELETDWWRQFGSAELEQLIDRALAGSPDIAVATERVLQAEIAARSARATLFPTINLDARTNAGRTREDGSTSRSEGSSAALGISYEIDVWGSNFARYEGSRYSLTSTRYDYEATRLSLVSGVANAYAQILSQRARLAIAGENLAIAERLFRIVEARYRAGAASALDVSRQRATVLSQRDAILPLQVTERQLVRALAILVGETPAGFDVAGQALDPLAIPEVVPYVPAELLVRRPDLAAAEADLAAADADIAVARAALFPLKLSLTASGNLSSGEFGFLDLANPVSTGTVAISLLQAIFDGGRLRGQVETSESQRRVTLENYRKAVLTALKEVDDAVANAERSRIQEVTQREIRDERARALRLSELRYKEGSDGLDTLLNAQSTLFSAEEALVTQRLTRLTATVDLYKALGGGWRSDEAGAQAAGSADPAS
ncbi:efflux transporter outer membrane subunit [Pseudothauera rhizosphaerae]|uniref:Efflux transporter outer membrane subunit n=1 Tax=Pseudothauera rhizosphaerae TaxID=2565932 RepID=A0A4S4ADN2_9RHOO|nr:efflux transporter outer membrane subunit [Pseudothauera rhizosphaerae]THF56872.1 efflux transporter outer membrane subunit [Pseudothauera rhizosphaerae]